MPRSASDTFLVYDPTGRARIDTVKLVDQGWWRALKALRDVVHIAEVTAFFTRETGELLRVRARAWRALSVTPFVVDVFGSSRTVTSEASLRGPFA